VELYPVFDSNEKIVLVNGCALRFISSLIRRSGQFLFFQSHSCPPPTEAIWLGSPSAAGLICAVHKQLLPVLICFSATGLPSPVSCSPCCRKRCTPLILFSTSDSCSVTESQGAAWFCLPPGQSLSFSLCFVPYAFPCSISFDRRRLCLWCHVLPPVDLVLSAAGYVFVQPLLKTKVAIWKVHFLIKIYGKTHV
jgi:hypothetical protein